MPEDNKKIEEKKEEVKKVEKKEDAKEDIKTGDDVKNNLGFDVPEKYKGMVEHIKKMSVLELHDFVGVLEEVFGVSASAVATVAQGGSASDGAVEEEKSLFTVSLTDFGAQKIAVIKVVKEVLGLGLKEAKDMVESAPVDMKKDMKKEDAEELKAKLEGAGGKVELK